MSVLITVLSLMSVLCVVLADNPPSRRAIMSAKDLSGIQGPVTETDVFLADQTVTFSDLTSTWYDSTITLSNASVILRNVQIYFTPNSYIVLTRGSILQLENSFLGMQNGYLKLKNGTIRISSSTLYLVDSNIALANGSVTLSNASLNISTTKYEQISSASYSDKITLRNKAYTIDSNAAWKSVFQKAPLVGQVPLQNRSTSGQVTSHVFTTLVFYLMGLFNASVANGTIQLNGTGSNSSMALLSAYRYLYSLTNGNVSALSGTMMSNDTTLRTLLPQINWTDTILTLGKAYHILNVSTNTNDQASSTMKVLSFWWQSGYLHSFFPTNASFSANQTNSSTPYGNWGEVGPIPINVWTVTGAGALLLVVLVLLGWCIVKCCRGRTARPVEVVSMNRVLNSHTDTLLTPKPKSSNDPALLV